MRTLLVAGSILALTAPGAFAQMAPKPATPAPVSSTQQQMQKFLVFFDWDKYNLTAEAQRVVAQAAEAYKSSGQVQVQVIGHTDTSGSPAYNQKLSERRADTVKREMIRLGVPAGQIVAIGRGQNDLLVPTKDGVREAQNRRAEILFPRPPAPPAPPPVQAKAPPPPPPPPPLKWSAELGPWYGFNFREKDHTATSSSTSASLVGPDVRVNYAPIPEVRLFAEGAGFNTVGTARGDGWGYRAVGGVDYQMNFDKWHPFVGWYGGYTGFAGVQDGAITGPEAGLTYDFTRNLGIGWRVGYDYNTRNQIWGGVINTALTGVFRF